MAGLRDRLNAWALDRAEGWLDERYGSRKRAMLGTVPPRVVEIGAGTGTNLRYYPPGTELIAFEPSAAAADRLRRRADRSGVRLDLRPRGAERLDLDDAAVDLVVGTLVLCSVDEPARVVAEIRRVLRPGGRYAFVEHVAARPGSAARGVQRVLRRPWRWASVGCRLLRDTEASIRAAGFASVEVERFSVGPALSPVSEQIAGVAVR